MCLRTPSKGFLVRLASLEMWEFTDSHRRDEFRGFANEIPGVLGNSLVGKYILVQGWALWTLGMIQKSEVSISGAQKIPTNSSTKQEKSLILLEVNTNKTTASSSSNTALVPIFHGDDMIAF